MSYLSVVFEETGGGMEEAIQKPSRTSYEATQALVGATLCPSSSYAAGGTPGIATRAGVLTGWQIL